MRPGKDFYERLNERPTVVCAVQITYKEMLDLVSQLPGMDGWDHPVLKNGPRACWGVRPWSISGTFVSGKIWNIIVSRWPGHEDTSKPEWLTALMERPDCVSGVALNTVLPTISSLSLHRMTPVHSLETSWDDAQDIAEQMMTNLTHEFKRIEDPGKGTSMWRANPWILLAKWERRGVWNVTINARDGHKDDPKPFWLRALLKA